MLIPQFVLKRWPYLRTTLQLIISQDDTTTVSSAQLTLPDAPHGGDDELLGEFKRIAYKRFIKVQHAAQHDLLGLQLAYLRCAQVLANKAKTREI